MMTGVAGGGRQDRFIGENMTEQSEQKKVNRRNAQLWISGQCRLDRKGRELFARLESASGTVPSKGIQKIRQGEQHPWRVLFRRLVEAQQSGTPLDSIDAVMRDLAVAVKDELTRRRGAGRVA